MSERSGAVVVTRVARMAAHASAVALACAMGACASGHAGSTAPVPEPPKPSASLERYLRRVREITSHARQTPKPPTPPQSAASASPLAVTIESWDGALRSALAELAAGPTADRHRRVAASYQRLRILDKAHAHFSAATRLDARDAASHDALARIWRDWGSPDLGLEHASTAVRLAPSSPVAANTLGTLLAAGGHLKAARSWYARAATLDPASAYARNNLCYAAVMLREAGAVAACAAAADVAPKSTTAQNNLGLAYAVEGDLPHARESFAAAGGGVAADFNLGIAHLARGEYAEAIGRFSVVLHARPAFPGAAARARQAHAALLAATSGADHDTAHRP